MNPVRLCLAAGLAAGVAASFGPVAALAQVSSPSMTKQASSGGPWKVTLGGSTGVATFQDVQVPVNQTAGLRGDGTTAQTEGATHAGLPLQIGLAFDYHPSRRWDFTALSLDAMNVQSATGPTDTQSSSYSRLQVGTAARYRLGLGDSLSGTLGATAAFRRSSFANVSTAHYIDAALVGGELGLDWGSVVLAAFARTAPYASFGYSSAAVLGGRALPGTTTSLNELGATLSFALRPGVWLDLGGEREMAHVQINDVSAYNGLGLNVQDTAHPTRVYDLATTVARLGFRREF